MNCHQVRRLLSVQREWAAQDRAAAESHLAGCPACQAVAREYELMDRRLGRLPQPVLVAASPAAVRARLAAVEQNAAGVEPVSRQKPASRALVLLAFLALVVVAAALVWSGPSTSPVVEPGAVAPDFTEAAHPVGYTTALDVAVQDDRINILLLGIDRRGGQGWGYRTDAILVVTVDPVAQTAGMLSIPRDLQLEIPGVGEDRINVANVYGYLQNHPGGGPALLEQTIETNFGIPIDYYVMMDFEGFSEMVDALGGLEVDVPKALHDTEYPNPKPGDPHGYKTIHFDAGRQHMNGEQALEYARSRMSTSDFDRAERQQIILLALQEKALKLNLIPKLPTLVETMENSVQTDVSLDAVMQLAQLALEIDPVNVKRVVIQKPMVYEHRREDGAHVYLPDWSLINALLEDMFSVTLASDSAQMDLKDDGFAWPVAGTLTQTYWPGHTAVDVANHTGTPVYAAADGVVAQAGQDDEYGNFVLLEHRDDYETFYSHLQAIHVEADEKVSQGQQIGEMGATGKATGPHLHFEVRHNGERLSPLEVVPVEARMDVLTSSLVPEINSIRIELVGPKLSWPTEGYVSQTYWIGHQALDIASQTGTPVYAAADGVVTLSDQDEDRHGIHLLLDHGDGYTTFYSHLSAAYVEVGEEVKRGQKIGAVGSTGLATGPHLHFEVHKDGEVLNPLELLP